ncbi:hypothetical protein GCM10023108_20170 [Saccharopolyspora hordei]
MRQGTGGLFHRPEAGRRHRACPGKFRDDDAAAKEYSPPLAKIVADARLAAPVGVAMSNARHAGTVRPGPTLGKGERPHIPPTAADGTIAFPPITAMITGTRP